MSICTCHECVAERDNAAYAPQRPALTKEEVAASIHCVEQGGIIVPEEIEHEAKRAGIVVVYCDSARTIEVRGAFAETVSHAYSGKTIRVDSAGVILAAAEDRWNAAGTIEILQGQRGCAWSFYTMIPHATFNIMDDEDVYCEGLVISIADLPQVVDWQKLAEDRLEKIRHLDDYLDGLAAILGVKKPTTPEEVVLPAFDIVGAVQRLQGVQDAVTLLRMAVVEADKYLEFSKMNTIGSGSQLHRAFKAAISWSNPSRALDEPLINQLRQEVKALREGTCTWKQPDGSDLGGSDCFQTECDGTTVTYHNGEAADMSRCYRCGRKLIIHEA